MPLPTLSLRAAPEHHRLIRDLAAALRTRPELADVLRDVLQAQHDPARMTERDADVLQALRDHVAAVERRVAALEATGPVAQMEAAPPRHRLRPGQPLPAEVQQRIRDMRAEGKTRKVIAAELGVSEGAVSKYMKPPAD